MKLSKLYTNQPNFKNITFNLIGLNVIYADVKAQESDKRNQHNLGKTLLSKIIDFLLLKGLSPNHVFKKKKVVGEGLLFEDHVFYLEILLNSGKFLTIRRGVENNTKISFKVHNQRTQDYIPPNDWDHEGVAIKNAKELLADFLNFGFFEDKEYDYRKAINYCLRMQGDYEEVYRLSKFKGRDINWKPFMFDLLGFNGDLLYRKYENDQKIEKLREYIDNIKNDFSVNTDERDELVAKIDFKKDEARNYEDQIDRFNFYEQDQSLIEKGVDEIELKISGLNSQAYELQYDIQQLEESIKNNFSFNLQKIKKVFEDSKLYFSSELEKDYEDLIEFNKRLTEERNRLLKKTLAKKKGKLSNVKEELKSLNQEKESLLSIIQDTEVFAKFKHFQKHLVKIEGELLKLQDKLNAIDNILSKEREIKSLNDQIEDVVEGLFRIYESTEQNQKYSLIRRSFTSYYKAIMNEDAFISWKINSQNNVEFNPPKVQSRSKQMTAKDEGTTYKKLLCITFDLTILTAYANESFFKFVYHDDALSQQDNGLKKRLIALVKRITEEYDLQYILSAIKSDLPVDSNDKPIYFSEEEIILQMHDKDSSGTLFGFEF